MRNIPAAAFAVAAAFGLITVAFAGSIIHHARHVAAFGHLAGFDIPNGAITGLAISPDGTRIAYTGDATVYIINAATGHVIASIPDSGNPIEGSGQGVIAFTPDGSTLILSSQIHDTAHYLSLWNATTGARLQDVDPLPGETGLTPAAMLSVAADGKRFATTDDKVLATHIRLFGLPGFAALQVITVGAISKLAVSADGDELASAAASDHLIFYNAATGRQVGALALTTNILTEPLSAMAYSPDGRYLATGFANGGEHDVPGPSGAMISVPNPFPTEPISIWPVKDGVPTGAPVKLCGPQPQGVMNFLWTPDSRNLIYSDEWGATKMCPISGAVAQTIATEPPWTLTIPALSADGSTLAIGGDSHIDLFRLNQTQDR